ncbi:MAG TPA: glycosyltransferase [Gaiellaceae bacterium]|jgi:UDP-N-acetylglucosamine transferase subunit ALG13
MIFVTVGTNEARFDRLLRAVADLRLDEELVVQHGHSSPIEVARGEVVDFLPFERMVELVRESRAVITHAGVGSVMVALSGGKRPIVVPRLKAHAEAVDDHQLQLGRRFAAAGLVTLVEDPASLADVVTRAQEGAAVVPTATSLAADLRLFVEQTLSRSAAHARA